MNVYEQYKKGMMLLFGIEESYIIVPSMMYCPFDGTIVKLTGVTNTTNFFRHIETKKCEGKNPALI
jgi:hypothetical protein